MENSETNNNQLIPENLPLQKGFLLHNSTEFPASLNLSYLSFLLNNLPGVAFVCRNDPETTIEYVSMGSVQTLGYPPEYLMRGKAFSEIVHPEDRVKNKKTMNSLTPEDSWYSLTYRIQTANGRRIWVNEQGHGLFSESGELRVVVGIVLDIQEQKHVEYLLKEENQLLKASVKERGSLLDLVGRSAGIQRVYDLILKASESEKPVAILGESGTGKELTARAIHELSELRDAAFIPVNCGAIPESLFESAFFGYKKGAFSGAYKDTSGYLEQANGGTLFLDEVGELPLQMQAKLLRALDGNGFTSVGCTKTRNCNFRVITATHRDLAGLVQQKQFRQDFFYRINVLPLRIPPLRDRLSDIPILVDHLLKKRSVGENCPEIPNSVILSLMRHVWPGNVRELENVISRYIAFGRLEFAKIGKKTPQPEINFLQQDKLDKTENLSTMMEHHEKQLIKGALERCAWKMGATAKDLGLNLRTLQRKLKKHGLR